MPSGFGSYRGLHLRPTCDFSISLQILSQKKNRNSSQGYAYLSSGECGVSAISFEVDQKENKMDQQRQREVIKQSISG